MKKSIVIYKTKNGSTKKYAKFIKEELDSDIINLENSKKVNLNNYDTIIFGGWVFASKIMGLNKFKSLIKNIKNKNIVVFFVGMANENDKENFNNIIKENFNKEEFKLFGLKGALKINKFGFLIKFFLNIARKDLEDKIKNNKKLTKEDEFFLKEFAKESDYVKKENIKNIIDYVKNKNNT